MIDIEHRDAECPLGRDLNEVRAIIGDEPPCGKRYADLYLMVVTALAFVATVLMLAYALSIR